MVSMLNRSLTNKEKLEMIYLDADGELSHRIIKVVKFSENDVLAYCFSKKQVRLFKKDSILSVYPYKALERMKA
ncbi:hypothetical protein [Jeotgalibacillus proteolyticus]|uniref:hypothetical protein n=1 Tax=Jeotgalibacillus proteolyticus TaxID=2082395 RepID=UPI003CF6D3FB